MNRRTKPLLHGAYILVQTEKKKKKDPQQIDSKITLESDKCYGKFRQGAVTEEDQRGFRKRSLNG